MDERHILAVDGFRRDERLQFVVHLPRLLDVVDVEHEKPCREHVSRLARAGAAVEHLDIVALEVDGLQPLFVLDRRFLVGLQRLAVQLDVLGVLL